MAFGTFLVVARTDPPQVLQDGTRCSEIPVPIMDRVGGMARQIDSLRNMRGTELPPMHSLVDYSVGNLEEMFFQIGFSPFAINHQKVTLRFE